MANRTVPHEVQSGVVTQIMIQLLEKHPDLLAEVREILSPLPESVANFIYNELTRRPYPYDLKGLTSAWTANSDTTNGKMETLNVRSRLANRRPR